VETLLHLGLSNALVASVLAVGAAAAGRFVRRPALIHSLWLLVLLKLLTPPLVPIHVAWQTAPAQEMPVLPQSASQPAVAETAETFLEWQPAPAALEPILEPPSVLELIVPEPAIAQPPAVENAAAVELPLPPEPKVSWPMPPWSVILLSAWGAGSACWLGLAGWRIARFGRLARQARPAPSAVLERVNFLCGRLGIAVAPLIGFVPGCVSPLLWALSGRPRLLLPATLWDQLDDDQRDALLVHELAHLRRRDHWIRNLELVATGLYWWHPVVWWARRALREAEEQCCDAWVVWTLPTSARAYATALLQTVDFLSGARPGMPAAASGLGHLSCLKRRLMMIMQEPTPRALSWAGRLAVLGLGAVLLPLAPSWAQRAADNDSTPQIAAQVDTDDDDDDAVRDRARADRKSEDGVSDEADDGREAQLEVARAQMRKLAAELAERRKQVESALDQARAQLESQMKDANRAMEQVEKRLQEAMGRVAELEGGRGERNEALQGIRDRLRRDAGLPPRALPPPRGERPGRGRGPGQSDVFIFRRDERRGGPGEGPPMPPPPPGGPSADGRGPGEGPPMPPPPPGGPGADNRGPGPRDGRPGAVMRREIRRGGVPGRPGPGGPGEVPRPGDGPSPPMPPPGGPRANSPETERRLDALERKLDRLLEEISKMTSERDRGTRSSSDTSPSQHEQLDDRSQSDTLQRAKAALNRAKAKQNDKDKGEPNR
jgi:beta-lactamase regulating signal transducer with metallopeptidase domain